MLQSARSVSTGDYRFGYQGQEQDNKMGGLGQHTTAQFWEYDTWAVKRWNMDPLAGKFPTQSPFVNFNDNPIILNDITGQSGEPSFANGTITITINLNFYGNSKLLNEGTREETIGKEAAYLQAALNKHPSDAMGPDGNMHPVVFVITGEFVTYQDALTKARNNVGENYDAKQNFIRLDDIAEGGKTIRQNSIMSNLIFSEEGIPDGTRSGYKRSPDNSIWLSSDNLGTTSSVHEIAAHQLWSRHNGSHLLDWSENPDESIPSIRTNVLTTNIPNSLSVLSKEGNPILDITRREVLKSDKENMFISWKGKARMGNSTNTIFTEEGNQIIYNKSKIKEEYDKNGNKVPNRD